MIAICYTLPQISARCWLMCVPVSLSKAPADSASLARAKNIYFRQNLFASRLFCPSFRNCSTFIYVLKILAEVQASRMATRLPQHSMNAVYASQEDPITTDGSVQSSRDLERGSDTSTAVRIFFLQFTPELIFIFRYPIPTNFRTIKIA
jgi:hypothetical protein